MYSDPYIFFHILVFCSIMIKCLIFIYLFIFNKDLSTATKVLAFGSVFTPNNEFPPRGTAEPFLNSSESLLLFRLRLLAIKLTILKNVIHHYSNLAPP